MMAEIIFLDQLSDQTGKTVSGRNRETVFWSQGSKTVLRPPPIIVPIKNAYLNQQTKGLKKKFLLRVTSVGRA